MNDIAVRIRGLRKHYGDLHAVDDLDLDIRQGEIFALLGPNGAGKTTTVEILEGYRTRDSGEVTVLGVDPAKATRGWRSRLGIVLQSTDDTSPISVREHLEHMSRIFPNPRSVDEVLGAVGLEEKQDSHAKSLSGGQRRRLDVGLGIIGSPDLLFLDEPTTGFDPAARRAFWKLIAGLRDDGTTILLTTHYLDEAEALADRLAVIANGRIVAENTPAGLRATASATHVSWTEGGVKHVEATTKPSAFIRSLLAKHKGEVDGLEVRRPSLEDVYLDLIGESARTLAAEVAA